MKIENINAIVTGGSSGLGKATVEIILSNGGRVSILDTQKELGEELAYRKGKKCNFYHTDVTDELTLKKNIETVEKQSGDINLTVNCAGKAFRKKLLVKKNYILRIVLKKQ